jgi:hypothetical protein
MRAALGKPGQVSRLVGLSGTGKTRLVQALFEPVEGTGSPLERGRLLYTDLGHSPDPSAREMLLRLGEAGQRAMVIVDNCNPNAHRTLTEVARQFPAHLSLLTVEYDVADEDSPEATDVFELAPSSGPVLESILARLAPHLDSSDRIRIVEFAGGNARIALALAGTVAAGETLGTLNDGELFRRLFRQGQADDEGLLRAAEACSLVYSFDGEDTQSDASELRISGRELFRHVSTLMRRDLVQSRSKWRAVLPPALANRLARSALQSIPRADIVDAFMSSERLLVSFSRRLSSWTGCAGTPTPSCTTDASKVGIKAPSSLQSTTGCLDRRCGATAPSTRWPMTVRSPQSARSAETDSLGHDPCAPTTSPSR